MFHCESPRESFFMNVPFFSLEHKLVLSVERILTSFDQRAKKRFRAAKGCVGAHTATVSGFSILVDLVVGCRSTFDLQSTTLAWHSMQQKHVFHSVWVHRRIFPNHLVLAVVLGFAHSSLLLFFVSTSCMISLQDTRHTVCSR